jgi:translation initiation factor eIF-2B subunit epsilon
MNTKVFDPDNVRKAIIIADSFTNLLNPINDVLPEVLLPICNIPILEYMLDFLFSNSIKEIIIVAKRHDQALSKYINKHYKKQKTIKLITSDDFTEMGDCLRKIYSEKLISSDFVLVRGLVIANFNLEKVFAYHLEKKEKTKNCILTSIFKTYKNDSKIRTKYDENVVVYDTQTKRVLQYESTYNCRKLKLNENIAMSPPKSTQPGHDPVSTSYRVRTDFYDTFIDICSPDVLNHFSDNFDYHSIRDDLYKNVLTSEIYTDHFYLYEIKENEYVGVIKNFETYFKVSNEIINRWAHPVVLEHLLTSAKLDINYKCLNLNIYQDGASSIDVKSKLKGSIAIGSGCSIAECASLTSVSLGKNAKIGRNCNFKNCIILDNCSIGDNVSLENVFLGSSVTIDSGLSIKDCYIGNEIFLSSMTSSEHTSNLINLRIKKEEAYDEDTEPVTEYTSHETFSKNLEDKDLMFMEYQPEYEDESDDEGESASEEEQEEDEENFEEEVKVIIQGGGKTEDIVLELISLQKAFWEKTIYDTIKYAMGFILDDFLSENSTLFSVINAESTPKIIAKLQDLFQDWSTLFKKLIQTPEMQISLIALMEDLCVEYDRLYNFFNIILQILKGDLEVLDDNVIVEWSKLEVSKYQTCDGEKVVDSTYHSKFVAKCKKFVESLNK